MMDIKVDGDKLILTVPLSSGVLSKSGKTLIVASTSGFVPVPDTDMQLSLNVIKPRKR